MSVANTIHVIRGVLREFVYLEGVLWATCLGLSVTWVAIHKNTHMSLFGILHPALQYTPTNSAPSSSIHLLLKSFIQLCKIDRENKSCRTTEWYIEFRDRCVEICLTKSISFMKIGNENRYSNFGLTVHCTHEESYGTCEATWSIILWKWILGIKFPWRLWHAHSILMEILVIIEMSLVKPYQSLH